MSNTTYAICNETFEGWEHAKICHSIAEWGYSGLEIAPYTLAKKITDLTGKQKREIRNTAKAAGVEILGLHWLLAKTEGYSLTSPDAAVRKATAEYFRDLAYACADMGGEILVLGSPLQRKVPEGYTLAQATEFAEDVIGQILPALDDTNTILALEPLGPSETDFWTTTAEVVDTINRLDNPRVQLHLDVKAMSSEGIPIVDIITQYAAQTVHFHANDANKRGPGFGEIDFVPIFKALKDVDYAGYVSVEVFDYTPDPETIAKQSIEYMKKCAAA